MTTLNVIYFPGYGPNCSENDGFGPEVFLTPTHVWERTVQQMQCYGNDHNKSYDEQKTYVAFDFSCGMHGCLIDFDIFDAFRTLQVIQENPSKDVISVIRKIEGTKFWDVLQHWLKITQPLSG